MTEFADIIQAIHCQLYVHIYIYVYVFVCINCVVVIPNSREKVKKSSSNYIRS